ncbi:HamA C-terminal domain-containing protein [Roseivirga pacifica]|uniref:HamA C-terminal domain-containing protein n=1 Tax=Roseivirga pacifica TaxID=1267423 RepID=UPI003BABDF1C
MRINFLLNLNLEGYIKLTQLLIMVSFEILIDDSFAGINSDNTLSPIENKRVLSLINSFEDGQWRYNYFQNFIWDNIAETSLSHKERESLVNTSYTKLSSAAQNLRLTDKEDDSTKGSEIAEIILYGIMKEHYGALPVVPKIFYKQNNNDFAKGADSVHIVLEGEDDFSLWFGEAKFYNSIETVRLGSIINSIENSLDTKKIRKENSIITNVSDLDLLVVNEECKSKIKAALAYKESIDTLKPKLQIPILLLHECEITNKQTTMSNSYREELKKYHHERAEAFFKKQLNKLGTIHLYSEIRFHIILFPVPNKSKIVDKFLNTANLLQNP